MQPRQGGERAAGADLEQDAVRVLAAASAMPSAKRTVLRRWRTQYSGSVASSARDPGAGQVRDERDASARESVSAAQERAPNSARIGSSIARVRGDLDLHAPRLDLALGEPPRRARSIAAIGPEATHSSGALIAASESSCREQRRAPRPPTAEREHARPGARCSNSRPRSATSASASSRRNTPARQAAVYSPMLWPISAAGAMPHDIHSCASAYSTMNSAGSCERRPLEALRGRLERRPARAEEQRRGSRRACAGSSSARHSSTRARKTGSRLVELARPCSDTARRRPGTGTRPRRRSRVGAARESRRSGVAALERSRTASSRSRHTSARRCANAAAADLQRVARRRRAPARGARAGGRASRSVGGVERGRRCAPRAAAAGGAREAPPALARRRLLEDDVRVGAADAERADAGAARLARRAGQARSFAFTKNGLAGEVDLRVRRLEVQARRQLRVLAAPARS